MRTGLTFLLCLIFSIAGAQTGFNVRDPLHSNESIFTSSLEYGHHYYTSGYCRYDSAAQPAGIPANKVGIKLAVFDTNGNRLWDTLYAHPHRNIYAAANSLTHLPDGRFLLAADDRDDSGKAYLLVLAMDSLFRPVSEREYIKPIYYGIPYDFWRLVDFKPAGNGQWLMLSTIRCADADGITNAQHDFLLTKLDSSFNLLWHHRYGDTTYDDVAGRLLIENDGYLLAGGFNTNNKRTNDYRAQIIKVDTAGNRLWSWLSAASQKINRIRDIIRTQDGGYLYCGAGAGYDIPAAGSDKRTLFSGWAAKLDAARNPVWGKALNTANAESEFTIARERPSGNIALFGNKYEPEVRSSIDYDLHTRGWFMTLNAAGDSLKERKYTGINSCSDYSIINDARPTADGGFILAGESDDNCFGSVRNLPFGRGWLVKVDSNGCIGPGDSQCWPVGIPQDPEAKNETRIYPNPVTAQLNIGYQNNGATGAVFILTDVTGKLLSTQSLPGKSGTEAVDMGKLSSGIYLYRITESGVVTKQGKVIKQ